MSRTMWERQEVRIVEKLKQIDPRARATIASGRTPVSKSDAEIVDLLRVEVKTSGARDGRGRKSITIKKEWLEKIEAEALHAGRNQIPVLAISFNDDKDYFVVEDYHFYNILKELVQLREELKNENLS